MNLDVRIVLLLLGAMFVVPPPCTINQDATHIAGECGAIDRHGASRWTPSPAAFCHPFLLADAVIVLDQSSDSAVTWVGTHPHNATIVQEGGYYLEGLEANAVSFFEGLSGR